MPQPWWMQYQGVAPGVEPTQPPPSPGNRAPFGNAYATLQQSIYDYMQGGRPTYALGPGYGYGQNVRSTDYPLPGELGYPNLGPGKYPTGEEPGVAPGINPSAQAGPEYPWDES